MLCFLHNADRVLGNSCISVLASRCYGTPYFSFTLTFYFHVLLKLGIINLYILVDIAVLFLKLYCSMPRQQFIANFETDILIFLCFPFKVLAVWRSMTVPL